MVDIIIFLLYLSNPAGFNPVKPNELYILEQVSNLLLHLPASTINFRLIQCPGHDINNYTERHMPVVRS
jgi:hypothetical protein